MTVVADISVLTTSETQVGGPPKLLDFIFWAPWISVPHFMTIYPMVVEILMMD